LRRAALRGVNGLLGALPSPSLDAATLMAEARERAGLHDFGDAPLREPLEVLVDSIEREARLHPLGRRITRTRLLGVLTNRLRVQEALAQHPEIGEEPVEAPLVIAGLQRTGTTLLHRLLASHPGLRSLASWEALHPSPHGGERARIRQAKVAELGLRVLAPEFFAIHPVQAHAPEEEVLLLDMTFLSTVPEATLRVPSFARWLEAQDVTPAYRYMRTLLQLLHWERRPPMPPGRWVLKTPHHLEHLGALFEVFPDARVVQTHRDPAVTLASFCSMIAHGRAVFSDAVDPAEIGRDWSRKVRRMLDRAMDARARLGDARFLDVRYEDLVADPAGTVREVLRWAEVPSGAEADAALGRALHANPQHKHGRHQYRLEDYGLDRPSLEALFADYRAQFITRA
jgi:hypothetical protein